MEVSGRIKEIGKTQEFGSNGFKKRECVVVTQEQYPQTIPVEFTQNNVGVLDAYKTGDDVTIQINLRGREWTNQQGETKYFLSLNGWRIEKAGAAPAAGGAPVKSPSPSAADAPSADDDDDLPF
ncbi:MAG: DUF3127 domain-containing protein [Flavobacteriales bacterium]|nr:DUF3127 domain-containing protein [Flavobacteriales bacterium]